MSFYFYTGYLIRKNYKNLLRIYYNKIICYILYVIFILFAYKYNEYNLTRISYPFLGILVTWLLSLNLVRKKETKMYKILYFIGENSLVFYLLEGFFGTIYRVILIKIIPIEYNFLLIISFFSLKIITIYLVIKYILSKNKIFTILLGVKYNPQYFFRVKNFIRKKVN